jgi:hypothetical protein
LSGLKRSAKAYQTKADACFQQYHHPAFSVALADAYNNEAEADLHLGALKAARAALLKSGDAQKFVLTFAALPASYGPALRHIVHNSLLLMADLVDLAQ